MKDVLIDIISERKSSGPFFLRDSRENTLDPGWSAHTREVSPSKRGGETKSQSGAGRNW